MDSDALVDDIIARLPPLPPLREQAGSGGSSTWWRTPANSACPTTYVQNYNEREVVVERPVHERRREWRPQLAALAVMVERCGHCGSYGVGVAVAVSVGVMVGVFAGVGVVVTVRVRVGVDVTVGGGPGGTLSQPQLANAVTTGRLPIAPGKALVSRTSPVPSAFITKSCWAGTPRTPSGFDGLANRICRPSGDHIGRTSGMRSCWSAAPGPCRPR